MKETLNKEIINKIRANFDINEYETKVWLSLLYKGISTIGEIAEISGVPRSRVYDVLESLERKGFVVMKLGKPIRYMAIHPNEVIERLKANYLNLAKEKIEIIEKIKNTEEYKQLELLFNQKTKFVNPEDMASLLKGRFNIYQSLKSSIANAKESILIFTTTDHLANKIKILKPLLPKLLKSKIKINIAASGDEEKGKKASKELGIKIRKVDFDARFCIIDGEEVFLMFDNSNPKNEFGIHIKSKFFASALENLAKKYLEKNI
jgi:sugar-specific transcriptional regulator TrmB